VHAPQPNETVNIDLCVVPMTHTDPTDWVSVSVNEAAGVFAETPSPAPVAEWPGQAFANPTLSYAEQMQTYVEKRAAKRLSKGQRKRQRRQKQAARAELNAKAMNCVSSIADGGSRGDWRIKLGKSQVRRTARLNKLGGTCPKRSESNVARSGARNRRTGRLTRR
jgi:hypothetical protein